MKRTKGKVLTVLLMACLFICLLSKPAGAGEESLAWVDDEAGLLNESTEEELEERAGKLWKETGYQFMLVTAADAGGKEAREFAEDYYMEHQSTLDGVIYLIDMDNRELYVATSGQMRYYLTDSRRDELLDEGYEAVLEGEYGEAFLVMLEETEEFLRQGIPEGAYVVDEDTGKITRYRRPKRVTLLEGLPALLAGIGCGGAVFAAVQAAYKGREDSMSQPSRNPELKLTVRRDRLINRFITHRHIPKGPPPGSHGGRMGGGPSSTVHTGSGGNSFGGGGRKF